MTSSLFLLDDLEAPTGAGADEQRLCAEWLVAEPSGWDAKTIRIIGDDMDTRYPVAVPVQLTHQRKCYCGRPTWWRFSYGRFLQPAVCWRCMSPEERGAVALYVVGRYGR